MISSSPLRDGDRHDLLARLDNLAQFTARVESAIGAAKAGQVTSTLLVVRIDRFADVQDILGNHTTNQVLQEIGDFLVQAVNKPFTATRLATGEFGLLLYDCEPGEATALAAFIRGRLNSAVSARGAEAVTLMLSTGFAAIGARADNAVEVIHRARFNLAIDPRLAESAAGAQSLCTALASADLALRFQPVVAFHEHGAARFAVQWQWPGPAGEAPAPALLQAQAAIHDFAADLDRQVLARVLGLSPADGPCRWHVPVNGATLATSALPEWLIAHLQEAALSPASLVLQVGANGLACNPEAGIAFCRSLDDVGLAWMLTAFGATADCVAALDSLKPGAVMLDESLIRDILYSQQQQRRARELVRAAHQRQAQVAAGGISDIDMLPLLWELGVDWVQGDCLQPAGQQPRFAFPAWQDLAPDALAPHPAGLGAS